MQIKVLIASPDTAVSETLLSWFNSPACADFTCDVAQPWSLLRKLVTLQPDVLLLEHSGPPEDAPVRSLRRHATATRILVMCEANTEQMTINFIQQGASGCLLKSSAASLWAKAVRNVHSGETWFGRTALLEALRSQITIAPAAEQAIEEGVLTRREGEILHLLGAALTNKEIARRLAISDKTVKTHLHHIYVKLNRSGRYKALLAQPSGLPGPAPQ